MQVGVVGLSHRFVSLSSLENAAAAFRVVAEKRQGILLSTCNRLEWYFSSPFLEEEKDEIIQILYAVSAIISKNLYCYLEQKCFYHLGQVVCGLDSALLGESEIQRQVKCAYEEGRQRGKLDPSLHYLFQKGLKLGKEIRKTFCLGEKAASLAGIIRTILEKETASVADLRFLLIGNSKTNQKIIHFFLSRGIKNLFLSTRSLSNVPKHVGLQKWSDQPDCAGYDVIICATYHDKCLIDLSDKKYKNLGKHVTFFDLSLPRLIYPFAENRARRRTVYDLDALATYCLHEAEHRESVFYKNVVWGMTKKYCEAFDKKQERKWSHRSVHS